jgi:hypothetical protein
MHHGRFIMIVKITFYREKNTMEMFSHMTKEKRKMICVKLANSFISKR